MLRLEYRCGSIESACKLTSHSARVARFRVPLGVRLSLISLLKLAKPLRLSHEGEQRACALKAEAETQGKTWIDIGNLRAACAPPRSVSLQ